jgi:hypothetical protein
LVVYAEIQRVTIARDLPKYRRPPGKDLAYGAA